MLKKLLVIFIVCVGCFSVAQASEVAEADCKEVSFGGVTVNRCVYKSTVCIVQGYLRVNNWSATAHEGIIHCHKK